MALKAMAKYLFALIIAFCVVVELLVPAVASGKGAPLRIDLYSWTVPPPELILNLGANQRPLRFTVARLERMTRSAVPVASHNGKQIRTFEGVDISWLTLADFQPKGSESRVTVQSLRWEGRLLREDVGKRCLEVSFGLFCKRKIPFSKMDGDTKVFIVDRVNRRILPGYSPFGLVIVTGQGRTYLYKRVTQISVRSSR